MMTAITDDSRLDDRAKKVLRFLVQRYLQDGNPVSSRALAGQSALPFSPATIRNVMSTLEDAGFLVSPHTSAGRVPSPRGIRFFIDQLLIVTPPADAMISRMQKDMRRATPAEAQAQAANVISQLTHYAGFVAVPAPASPVVRQLRFVKLSTNRVLAVIVTDRGDVLNRVFLYEDVRESELGSAAATYNRYFANMTFAAAQTRLRGQMLDLRGQISRLLKSLLDKVAEESVAEDGMLQVAGEVNLLKDEDLSGDMRKLRDLYDLLVRKKELMSLLALGDGAENVRVFIGSESGLTALDECSLVFSSCGDEGGRALGLVGIVGPKRMRYSEVIPTVEVAAKALRRVLGELRVSS